MLSSQTDYPAANRGEQRLKGAIDSRIAEEQARQRATQASPSRSQSGNRRQLPRDESPSKRPLRAGARGSKDGELNKGPDPADFEPEFVIGESATPSRSGTPRPTHEKEPMGSSEASIDGGREGGDGQPQEKAAGAEGTQAELPVDVRSKLRKLDKLESKYHELLRSYRLAHARVSTIEPFEASLRENTPLTSISDPGALVEYLNQLNLKGDMVLDELKRVTSKRDTTKQKLEEAEKNAKDAWDEVASLRKHQTNGIVDGEKVGDDPTPQDFPPRAPTDGDPLGATMKSPTGSVESRKGSLTSLAIFSPNSKAADSPVIHEQSEDLFSYDNELPRVEAELKEKQKRINALQIEVKTLKGDLAVTRESTQSMANSLEEATRELHALRDSKDRSDSELEEEKARSQKTNEHIIAELRTLEDRLEALKAEMAEKGSQHKNLTESLEKQLEEARHETATLRSSEKPQIDHQEEIATLESTIQNLEAQTRQLGDDAEKNDRRIDTLNGLVSNLRGQLKESEGREQELDRGLEKTMGALVAKEKELERTDRDESSKLGISNIAEGVVEEIKAAPESTATGKKKKKKKKKAGKNTNETSTESTETKPGQVVSQAPPPSDQTTDTVNKLQGELKHLRALLEEKDTAIENTGRKLKDQDDLRDEIESLRDDLLNIGQEHVEAKDQCKQLLAEKSALQKTISDLENEVSELKGHADSTAGSDEEHKTLLTQFDDLKAKATGLQTELSAAEQLATSRFKDISELKSMIQKAQPELSTLRSENAELKSIREALEKKESEVKKLNAKHEEMRSEGIKLKQIVSDRDAEIKSLDQKISQETSSRARAEEAGSKSAQEVSRLFTERRQANESIDRLSTDLSTARQDLASSRAKLRDVEQQLAKFRNDNEGFKEEAELKTAQYASAQSLMSSMRDQTAEMAMQTKEAKERCESLEEEVAEAHRLLGERSREAETMRRLLADVEGRADARTREMKERMDTAIEERDRAEDEASSAGRRRAREMEELRNKVRETERNLKRAEEDKEELENAQRDWKRRREGLEQRSARSTQEIEEVRSAMVELRDALDESEKQGRDLEKQKGELRRSVEESQTRLEKLQKSNKTMADDLRTFQTARTRAMDSGGPSSRSSMDSGPSRSRLASPTPASPPSADAANGQAGVSTDYFYLKNVLLQFLEQKDKNHQKQLIPVLAKLLHFDRKDEQKWMSAITAR